MQPAQRELQGSYQKHGTSSYSLSRHTTSAKVAQLTTWDYGCTQSRPGAATAATQWRCARDATAGPKVTAEPTDAAAEPPAIGVLWPEREKRAIWQGLMEWHGQCLSKIVRTAVLI